jgi:hypothetical protein
MDQYSIRSPDLLDSLQSIRKAGERLPYRAQHQ